MDNYDIARLARLEQKVDYLIAYLGIDPALVAEGVLPGGGGLEVAPPNEVSNAALSRVYDAVRRGKKIEAIKLYRDATGARLADAKAAVDSIARGL